jgi:hypothetical protein
MKPYVHKPEGVTWDEALAEAKARAAMTDPQSLPVELPPPEVVDRLLAEAYQVVGSLLTDVGQFESDAAEKILDNLSEMRLVHDDVLPWPSMLIAAEQMPEPLLVGIWNDHAMCRDDAFTADQMRAYATACVLAEREACAQLCEQTYEGCDQGGDDEASGFAFYGENSAAAIRAR